MKKILLVFSSIIIFCNNILAQYDSSNLYISMGVGALPLQYSIIEKHYKDFYPNKKAKIVYYIKAEHKAKNKVYYGFSFANQKGAESENIKENTVKHYIDFPSTNSVGLTLFGLVITSLTPTDVAVSKTVTVKYYSSYSLQFTIRKEFGNSLFFKPYISVGAGYKHINQSIVATTYGYFDKSISISKSNVNRSTLAFETTMGCTYWATKHLGFYAACGLAKTFLQAGVIYKIHNL